VEFITFIWLVLSGLGAVALLMLVQEVRAFRGEARHIRHVLRIEMMELQRLLSQQESSRICRAAREAEERLSAVREGRGDAEQRIDVGRVLDETKAATWGVAANRLLSSQIDADAAWEEERGLLRSSPRMKIRDD
jgi:hypothetical protein